MAKVLLIEDDLPLVRMYQVAFSRSGHQLIEAIDGEEGQRTAQKEKPDLILLDLMLPKKSGFEVLKDLKGSKELSHIPVLCLSVLHQSEDIQKCKDLGADDYLVKTDVEPQEVVSKVLARLKLNNGSVS